MLTEAALKEVYEKAKKQVYQELDNKAKVIHLNEDGQKKLYGKIPPCIDYILKENPPKSDTIDFNKLVLNLVNYFQMAGYTEEDAWILAEPFLEHYMSSETYDTPRKRREHWKSEWKYLQDNPDYNFNCSYVKGLKLPGNAFSCFKCAKNEDKVKTKPSDFSSDEILDALYKNEDGDADLFIKLFKDSFCFDHTESRWYIRQNNGHWYEDMIGEATAAVKGVIKVYATEQKRQNKRMLKATEEGKTKEAEKTKKTIENLLARIKQLRARKRKADIIYLAATGKGSLGITGLEWDNNPWFVGCRNGIINLKTGELKPIDPKSYIKTVAPTDFVNLNTPAPTWEKFLSEIFKHNLELVNFMQRLLGYAIVGEVTEDIFPILWGEEGRNGKDTLFETLKYVLGDHASPIESELLLAQRFNKRAGSATPELKSLKGKRIVWASETEEGRKFDVSKIKYYTGGGSIVARGLYDRRFITFEPSHTMFLITNPKPKAKGDDPAFWERVFLIPLTQRFVADPKEPNEHKADIYILDKLKKESSGILSWLVRGCLQWQQMGLSPPNIVKQATQEYQYESDEIARFVGECCVRHPNSQVRPKILHETYQNWATENANETLSPKTFFQKIKRFIDDEFRNKKGKVYLGLGLSETEFETNLVESFGD